MPGYCGIPSRPSPDLHPRNDSVSESSLMYENYILNMTDNEEFNEVTARLEDLRESEKKYFELEVKGLMNEQMTKNHTKLVGEMLQLEDKRKSLTLPV